MNPVSDRVWGFVNDGVGFCFAVQDFGLLGSIFDDGSLALLCRALAPVDFIFDKISPFIPAYGEDLKCDKGNWWMPWHREAMKDVALCDKLWGGESNL